MSYRYKYLGAQPQVFINIRYNDQTFAPEHGDEIVWHEPINHPLLELVKDDRVSKVVEDAAPTTAAVKEVIVKPAVPDQTESPAIATVDESKEN